MESMKLILQVNRSGRMNAITELGMIPFDNMDTDLNTANIEIMKYEDFQKDICNTDTAYYLAEYPASNHKIALDESNYENKLYGKNGILL